MTTTVFGSTGRTGIKILRQALEKGHAVRAFTRSPGKIDFEHANLRVIIGEMDEMEKIEEAVRGADAVIDGLGWSRGSPPDFLRSSARKILYAMQKTGVRRYVGLTGAGGALPGDPKSIERNIMYPPCAYSSAPC